MQTKGKLVIGTCTVIAKGCKTYNKLISYRIKFGFFDDNYSANKNKAIKDKLIAEFKTVFTKNKEVISVNDWTFLSEIRVTECQALTVVDSKELREKQ